MKVVARVFGITKNQSFATEPKRGVAPSRLKTAGADLKRGAAKGTGNGDSSRKLSRSLSIERNCPLPDRFRSRGVPVARRAGFPLQLVDDAVGERRAGRARLLAVAGELPGDVVRHVEPATGALGRGRLALG